MAALHKLVLGPGPVVAQIVEPKFVVRAIGDVGGVSHASLGRSHLGEDAAHLEAKETVNSTHPLGVALGEVVVHCDDVHALTCQGVEVRRQGGNQGLTFTGAHFGDVAEVQGGPTHHLHVVVALAQGTPRRLTNRRECLGQQHVERLAIGVALLVLIGERAKFGVGIRLEVGLEGVHLRRDSGESLDDAAFAGAQDLVENGHRPIVGDDGQSGDGPVARWILSRRCAGRGAALHRLFRWGRAI